MRQLVENIVRVRFITRDNRVNETADFDLVIDDERRAMGKKCAVWQSTAVGNKVESVVLTIVREGD